MPCPVAEQTLVDAQAVSCQVPISFAPLASVVVLFWAVFPPICEIIEPSIEHGLQNIQGHWGIVEDAWLEAVEGIGTSKGSQGVLFFPSRVVV
jgi:hypothetical protein